MRCTGLIFRLILLLIALPCAANAELYLNEIQSCNEATIADEDGDYPDWIEIFNSGPEPVNLGNFGLSDDDEDPFKWTFANTQLGADQRLLVFASGKDRRIWSGHLETVINHGDLWHYKVWTSTPPSDWNTLAFDAAGWDEGPSGFGIADGDDATILPNAISCHIRKVFAVSEASDILNCLLHLDYDDAFVAYLNGVEVARSADFGTPGTPVDWNVTATGNHEAQMYQGGLPECFPLTDYLHLLQSGSNVLAIQIHNVWAGSDMTLIPFLTLGTNGIPDDPQGVPDILNSETTLLHTNFKIADGSETILLTDRAGMTLDALTLQSLPPDISTGRYPDGDATWWVFEEPTPGGTNDTADPLYGFAPAPLLLMVPGFYDNPITLTLNDPSGQAEMHYTLDGSLPVPENPNAILYTTQVSIDTTTVVRARATLAGYLPSDIATSTYFIGEQIDLPVVSLSTAPENLWSDETGIYAMGPNAEPGWPYLFANFYQDWERPIHMEFFTTEGERGFSVDAGTKIHGGSSRPFPQKSLRIIMRDEYGDDEIDYPIFRERENTRFKRLVLRNSGQDFGAAHIRDGLADRIAVDSDLDRMAYEPVVVFLNGMYWGLHGLREKMDDHFLESHYGVDSDSVNMVEAGCSDIYGGCDNWNDLIDFLELNDMSDPAAYAELQTMIEVESLVEYHIFEVFLGNADWPHHNNKRWRPLAEGGRWRWMLFDMDNAIGRVADAGANYIAHSIRDDGYPPAWSTFLIRSLLESPEFRQTFLNGYADKLNSTFRPENTLSVLETAVADITSEIPRHRVRWPWDDLTWEERITEIETFLTDRPANALSRLIYELGVDGTRTISVAIDPPGAGEIEFTLLRTGDDLSGTYFEGVPVPLTVHPNPGFGFTGWSGSELPALESVILPAEGNLTITAHFESVPTAIAVINEVNYNSADDFNVGDWVEFHNPGDIDLDMSLWQFKDDDDSHVFTFPEGTTLTAGDYLVIVREDAPFSVNFPDVQNKLAGMDFGLSGSGELLRLFDAEGVLHDSVHYTDDPPWPTEPDGTGPTLELIHADADNSLAENWHASTDHGTPGAENSCAGGVGVEENDFAPAGLVLDRAFPNPFNPATTLRFGLPADGRVRLEIFDIAGRRIAQPVDKVLPAGWHEFTWQPQNIASGVYFARLVSPAGTRNQKLLLLK
ncbi:MAG: T9SS type A sorting domain-containing protein [bacterium]|nr:T9SS type A sorting domain-containing protein [bacterium]